MSMSMNEPKVIIIGYGTVGKNLHKELSQLHPDINDNRVRKDYLLREYDILAPYAYPPDKYDFAFICVDTPLKDNGRDLDVREVQNALEENNADVYVIKSTCPVDTTYFFTELFGGNKKIVYSPEFYGSTQHCNNFDFNYTILGGDKSACVKVQQLLQNCYDARHTFHITDSRTAELAKLMENAWIATKVSFCTQFYEIAKDNNIRYEELRELFILDPRVNPAHTFVYADHPYWSSHCLDKDVPHLAYSEPSAGLLRSVVEYNSVQQENRYF